MTYDNDRDTFNVTVIIVGNQIVNTGFKSCNSLFAFPFALMPLGKA